MSDYIGTPSVDPTADFLARERAALGEDADFFENDADDAAGVSFSPLDSPALPSPSVFTPNREPLTPGLHAPTATLDDVFPPAPETPGDTEQSINASPPMPEEDPETVRQWKSKQEGLLKARDEASEIKREDTIQQARRDIDKFYEDYNDKKQLAIEQNRQKEQAIEDKREAIQASANIWDRVIEECAFDARKEAKRDTSRMKEIMQALKKVDNPPGNTVELS
ncbi:clathrin light chain [Gongronella butleri]|nr:clathrin light chain [Gongronella butleri]